MDTIFKGLFDGELAQTISVENFLLCLGVSLVLGVLMAAAYTWKNEHTRSFLVTIALLPAVVCVVIMMVNGNVGIIFSGGRTIVISNSSMNSALDTENGYTYTAGTVLAIMPQGGMSSEAKHCDNFSSIGASKQASLTSGNYLIAEIGDATATLKIPASLSAMIIVLGSNSPSISTVSSTEQALDDNGVAWS